MYSSYQRSMLAHKSSASKIEETDMENRFSNLLRLEADKLLPLLHLISVLLVFLLKCCNNFSLMCDGCLLASPLFSPYGGSRRLFLWFPVSMGSTLGGLFWFAVLLCMNRPPALGKILLMIVGAHAILYLAFSFQLCGFDAANPYLYRKPSQQRISTSHVLRRSCSEMQHASQ